MAKKISPIKPIPLVPALLACALVLSLLTYGYLHQTTNHNHLKLERASLNGTLSTAQLNTQINILNHHLINHPNHLTYLSSLARSYATLSDWPHALDVYEKITQLAPNNPDFLMEKAHVLIQQNSSILLPQIITLIKQTLLINPQQTYALLVSGLISYEIGQLHMAQKIWQKHQQLTPPHHPNFTLVQQYLILISKNNTINEAMSKKKP